MGRLSQSCNSLMGMSLNLFLSGRWVISHTRGNSPTSLFRVIVRICTTNYGNKHDIAVVKFLLLMPGILLGIWWIYLISELSLQPSPGLWQVNHRLEDFRMLSELRRLVYRDIKQFPDCRWSHSYRWYCSLSTSMPINCASPVNIQVVLVS